MKMSIFVQMESSYPNLILVLENILKIPFMAKHFPFISLILCWKCFCFTNLQQGEPYHTKVGLHLLTTVKEWGTDTQMAVLMNLRRRGINHIFILETLPNLYIF